MEEKKAKTGPVKFIYFPLFAKGPATALALNHSGIEWEGCGPGAVEGGWQVLKPTLPWRELPVLEVPGVGTIGHEVAILSFIATELCPAVAGANVQERVVSSQLLSQAEDIYQKLVKVQPTSKATDDKVSKEDYEKMWGDTNQATHNRNYGFHVYLTLLEEYYTTCGTAANGRFTSSGTTVGECKLFASLHSLKMIKDEILEGYPNLQAFHAHFASLEKTQEILTTGGKMGSPFEQYFIRPS